VCEQVTIGSGLVEKEIGCESGRASFLNPSLNLEMLNQGKR